MNAEVSRQFNLIATEYDKDRPKFIPCFDDFYGRCTSIITRLIDKPRPKILDLGTGTGLLTAFWLQYLPDAEFYIMDNSVKMLEIAGQRFTGRNNIRLIKGDYINDMPEAKYDTIISALSLHHIDCNEKPSLYKKIYDNLTEDGLFINYDQYLMDSEKLEKLVESDWYNSIMNSGIDEKNFNMMLNRRTLDREVTVEEELCFLKRSGFSQACCLFRCFKFAVIVARKT